MNKTNYDKEHNRIQYHNKLKDPKWQKKRLEIFNRDSFTCTLCGDKESTLAVHHKEYAKSGNPWDVDNSKLITVCEQCHQEIETALQYKIDIIKVGKIMGINNNLLLCLSASNKVYFRLYDKNQNLIKGFPLEDEKVAVIDELITVYKERLR